MPGSKLAGVAWKQAAEGLAAMGAIGFEMGEAEGVKGGGVECAKRAPTIVSVLEEHDTFSDWPLHELLGYENSRDDEVGATAPIKAAAIHELKRRGWVWKDKNDHVVGWSHVDRPSLLYNLLGACRSEVRRS